MRKEKNQLQAFKSNITKSSSRSRTQQQKFAVFTIVPKRNSEADNIVKLAF